VTILLEILVVAAIVFGAVAYAVGWFESMAPAPPDSGEVGLPDGPLTATAIERTRFGLAFRGYRMAEVDEVLDRLRDEVARRDEEAARREQQLDVPEGASPDISDESGNAGEEPAPWQT
jgi:DivIVA domain-containing protein